MGEANQVQLQDCNSDGYMYNFSPYCVKTGNIQGMHGLRVTSEWTSVIPASHSQNCTRFFDKFFTSVDILNMLKMNFKATGNTKETLTSQCRIVPTKDVDKQKDRDFCDYCFDKANSCSGMER